MRRPLLRSFASGAALLVSWLCVPSPGAAADAVLVGLDRIANGEHRAPAGRVGLLAHAASVTLDGRHAIDVLRERGVDLVRLFSPEHGLRGEAAAGEKVAGGTDERTGLPIVSLYGARTSPDPEDLRDLDVLVADLQDAGVRFYTYAATLLRVLDAAAAAGVELWVLDRPNPLGGERIEGPVADRDRFSRSLLVATPGPLVHGLTLGEMARFENARRARPASLEIVAMRGWRRSMTWTDTGRNWVAPSPNLRSPDAAIAYPGVALLEATNVSEGRGTAEPFLRLGAPWLDAATIERLRGIAVPGFELSPTRFVPQSSAVAPSPKYRGEECAGVAVRVSDAAAAQPYRLGLELLAALARHPAFAWRDEGRALARLLGTPAVHEMLSRGESPQAILERDRADHAAWREARRPFLLYE